MPIEIALPFAPPKTTAQQKGVFIANGRPRFFTKAKVRDAHNFLSGILAPFVPAEPLEGPVRLVMTLVFPFRKSEKKSVVRAGELIPHTVRPDLDNLEKGLLDTMTRLGFWRDDSQIFEKDTKKCWGPAGRMLILIQEVTK